MEILNGRELKKKQLEQLKEKLLKLQQPLGFAVIQVGHNEASNVYIRQKQNIWRPSLLLRLLRKVVSGSTAAGFESRQEGAPGGKAALYAKKLIACVQINPLKVKYGVFVI